MARARLSSGQRHQPRAAPPAAGHGLCSILGSRLHLQASAAQPAAAGAGQADDEGRGPGPRLAAAVGYRCDAAANRALSPPPPPGPPAGPFHSAHRSTGMARGSWPPLANCPGLGLPGSGETAVNKAGRCAPNISALRWVSIRPLRVFPLVRPSHMRPCPHEAHPAAGAPLSRSSAAADWAPVRRRRDVWGTRARLLSQCGAASRCGEFRPVRSTGAFRSYATSGAIASIDEF